MRINKPVELERITQVLAKGACPICAFLKNEQAALLRGKLKPAEVTDLCNFHAWALAAAMEGQNAAQMFLNVLRHRRSQPASSSGPCSFCSRLLQQEVVELRELIEQMNGGLVLEWMRQSGTLCQLHGNHLRQLAPLKLHPVIDEIMQRSSRSIEFELESVLRRSAAGKSGGGVLGRAAELLVSQRGIGGGQ
jgi:hypothetical protein